MIRLTRFVAFVRKRTGEKTSKEPCSWKKRAERNGAPNLGLSQCAPQRRWLRKEGTGIIPRRKNGTAAGTGIWGVLGSTIGKM